ncbi:MAG TPA: hypothetical protein VIK10_02610 [Prolixibacteraceae bacterium]
MRLYYSSSISILLVVFLPVALFAQPRTILLNQNWKAKRAMEVVADGSQISSPYSPVRPEK